MSEGGRGDGGREGRGDGVREGRGDGVREGRGDGVREGRGEGEREGRGEGERPVRQRNRRRHEPGMSVLQDSVLGMPPDGRHLWYSTVEPILPLLCPIGVCIRVYTCLLFTHAHTHTCIRTNPAFHDVEDSLASFGPGPGDFPSISNFDQSLLLPEFPTEHTDNPTPRLATIQESEVSVCVWIYILHCRTF